MAYEQTITRLDGGAVMAECGPMRLVISSFVGQVVQPDMSVAAARASFGYLERVARLQKCLKQRHDRLPKDLEDPLAHEMVRSVLAVGDGDLTPIAAVAGTIGDAVADFLSDRGMTRGVVDNGGDVAIRLRGEDAVRIGIRTDVQKQSFDHVIALDPRRSSWGVATSGLGGRSLTKGIASAATVVASTASLADAAATAVANASFVEDDHVDRRLAEEMDPLTDIPGIQVTVRVGPVTREKREEALSKAMERAEELVSRGVVFGALVVVDGEVGMTAFIRDCLVVTAPLFGKGGSS
jgi:ApbE superfamily uncharacterized protein (UPF0280 family)